MHEHLSDEELQKTFHRVGFISRSPNMMAVLRRARKAAEVSDVTVLLEGETGTGKQVLARAIHELDQKRRGFSFVTVHCSTISEALAESELFGHQRGAFSGAFSNRKGLFQSAHHGTLFLDDVNDLPFPLQPKLLDVIQRGSVRPVGCDHEVRLDVRIVAACNQPLEPLVREKRFRADLFHRLNVVKLSLPPLRGRASDLSGLILGLAKRYPSLYSPIEQVEPQLLGLLAANPFLGNVRELENAVQRMLFLKTEGTSLGVADWTAQLAPAPPGTEPDLFSEAANAMWRAISQRGISYARACEEIERRVLETAISVQGATRRQVAERLRTSERTLYYKMRANGLRHPGGMHS
jgi:DNA-binding NtrC family response regulator